MKAFYADLVCPMGKFPLKHDNEMLICTNCGAGFRINDSIPDLLLEDIILPKDIDDILKLKCCITKK